MHTLWWIRAKGSINIQRWLGSASVNGRQQDLCSDRSRMRNGIFSFLSVRFFFLSLPPPSPPPPHTDRRGAGSYGGRGVTFKIHQKTNKVIFWRLLRGIRYCSCPFALSGWLWLLFLKAGITSNLVTGILDTCSDKNRKWQKDLEELHMCRAFDRFGAIWIQLLTLCAREKAQWRPGWQSCAESPNFRRLISS